MENKKQIRPDELFFSIIAAIACFGAAILTIVQDDGKFIVGRLEFVNMSWLLGLIGLMSFLVAVVARRRPFRANHSAWWFTSGIWASGILLTLLFGPVGMAVIHLRDEPTDPNVIYTPDEYEIARVSSNFNRHHKDGYLDAGSHLLFGKRSEFYLVKTHKADSQCVNSGDWLTCGSLLQACETDDDCNFQECETTRIIWLTGMEIRRKWIVNGLTSPTDMASAVCKKVEAKDLGAYDEQGSRYE
jgi:hypothetical protein